MVSSEELMQMKEEEKTVLKMAIVAELFDTGTAKIKFYGEDIVSEKEYSYLSSYKPEIGDAVILLPLLDTFIIAGSILYKEVVANKYITIPELDTKLTGYSVTSHSHGQYAPSSHAHDRLYYEANTSSAGQVFITRYSDGSAWIFRPNSSGNTELGSSTYKWKNIYSTSGTIQTSDAREKEFISLVREDKRYMQLFSMLIPKSYKMKEGTSGRTHVGFYSQDIEKAMELCGLTSIDFAGFIKSPVYKENEEGNDTEELGYTYGLRYEEFHALEVAVIQDMNERLIKLEGRVLVDNS